MKEPSEADGCWEAVTIVDATHPPSLALARALFAEYGAGLGIDLTFQRFDEEVASLPGPYAEPRGRLLVAESGGHALGCVALREVDGGTAEFKRVYVRGEGRGRGMGRGLTEAVLAEARELRYRSAVLDTLPSMVAAQRLYEELGFRDTEPYTCNPISGTRFLRLELGEEG